MNPVVGTLNPFYYHVRDRYFKIVVEGELCSHRYSSLYAARTALAQFKFGKDTANWTVEVVEVVLNDDGNTYVRQRLEGLLTTYGTEEHQEGEIMLHYAWLAIQWIWNQATEIAGEVVEAIFNAAIDIGVSVIMKIIALL